jgi:hypothetical protein
VSWLRLEGGNRDPEVAEGLAARIADPLWLLARQWQVGEFAGEDAASPVLVTAEVAVTPITAFAPGGEPGGGDALGRADADRPLEVLVEQEAAPDDLRLTLDLGWTLLRALFVVGASTAPLEPLRAAYAPVLPPDDGLDPAGRAELELLARRSVDGLRFAADLATEPERSAALGLLGPPGAAGRALREAALDWRTAATGFVRLPTTEPSWHNAPLEYRFRVAAPHAGGELGLSATEYRGGTLDWYHFARDPDADSLGATGAPATRRLTVLPTPLRFHGMPAPRFWSIEDETVSFGDLVGGAEDLVRAVVGGFAAVYGNDWMVVPCNVSAGSVAQVTELTVIDGYGRPTPIPAAAVLDGPDRVWRFFELDGEAGPGAPLLLLAPALPDTEEGLPLERVDLLRDEVANLAWAIERRAVAASGRSVDRDAAAALPDATESGDGWAYDAFTPVPANWIPLVPVRREAPDEEVYLRRGRVAVPPPGMTPEQLLPHGRVLDASAPLRVDEAAIPDAGLRLDRRYQRARGADGRVHLWLGRRVRTGAWPAAAHFTADRLHQGDAGE